MTRFSHKNSVLLLVEGQSDEGCFNAILKHAAIGGISVITPAPHFGQTGGVSAYGIALAAIGVATGVEKLQHLVIIGDNDDAPESSFRKICREVQLANESLESHDRWPIPSEPSTSATANGREVTIFMLPDQHTHGCLETLCMNAMLENDERLKACIESFESCVDYTPRNLSEHHKFVVRLGLAAKSKNPNHSLAYVWNDPELVPIVSKAFDGIRSFLKSLITSVD